MIEFFTDTANIDVLVLSLFIGAVTGASFAYGHSVGAWILMVLWIVSFAVQQTPTTATAEAVGFYVFTAVFAFFQGLGLLRPLIFWKGDAYTYCANVEWANRNVMWVSFYIMWAAPGAVEWATKKEKDR